jgi:hypothetical protein
VALDNSELTMVSTHLEQCHAKKRGGGLFANKSLLSATKCTFRSDSAPEGAALMYEPIRSANDDASTMRELTFENNLGEDSILDIRQTVE